MSMDFTSREGAILFSTYLGEVTKSTPLLGIELVGCTLDLSEFNVNVMTEHTNVFLMTQGFRNDLSFLSRPQNFFYLYGSHDIACK